MLYKTFSPHFVDHSPSLWVGPSQHSQASICYYYFYYNGKSTILSIRSLTPDNSMLTFLRRYANVTSILRRLKGQSRQRKENKNTVIFFFQKSIVFIFIQIRADLRWYVSSKGQVCNRKKAYHCCVRQNRKTVKGDFRKMQAARAEKVAYN